MVSDQSPRYTLSSWVTVAAIVVAGLPTLVFAYLPMTDVPQHLAIASIIEHRDDPAWGFGVYEVDWWRTPYVLPYAMMTALGTAMPLDIALRIVVFVSVIACPLASVMLLRAARKPPWLALLAIPFVYNRTFFWGFIGFQLSIGCALAAFALYVEPRKSAWRDVAQAALLVASVFSHVYGLALAVVLLGTYLVTGGYATLRGRPWSFAALVGGLALWALRSAGVQGHGDTVSPPLVDRIGELPSQLLGGYRDPSEAIVLALWVVAWLALAWPRLPVSRARIAALTPLERTVYLVALGNLALYFVLPQNTATAKLVHFRHAVLAVLLLPLVATGGPLAARVVATVVATAAIVVAWVHLALFDREARTFDPIVDALPRNPRIVALVFDQDGDVMRTRPYMHFAAYAQARRGGLISMSFPAAFWNLPVSAKPEAIPSAAGLEWYPQFYDDKAFGYFYDHALLRVADGRRRPWSAAFPYVLVEQSGAWQLYRRAPEPAP